MSHAGQMHETWVEGVPFVAIRKMKVGKQCAAQKKVELGQATVG